MGVFEILCRLTVARFAAAFADVAAPKLVAVLAGLGQLYAKRFPT